MGNKNIQFPNEPTIETAYFKGKSLSELLQEHRSQNIIRLLTRLLFVWFIKEKKLIPDNLFDITELRKILKSNLNYHSEGHLLEVVNNDSIYYKTILQNLFFATLNCPINTLNDGSGDTRKRGWDDGRFGFYI